MTATCSKTSNESRSRTCVLERDADTLELHGFSGNLIAVLAVPKTVLPVHTLEELAHQDNYRYGLIDNSALYSLFQV